jgi:ribonucleotide reductase beta subunit family protein with ferritin-like domain
MKTAKETLEDWVEYFQSELAAGAIDALKFPEMTQKEINDFFGNKVTRGKVMKRIYRKLRENKHSYEKAKLILSKYNEQPTGNIVEFIQGILPEAFKSGSDDKGIKKASRGNDIKKAFENGDGDGRDRGGEGGGENQGA